MKKWWWLQRKRNGYLARKNYVNKRGWKWEEKKKIMYFYSVKKSEKMDEKKIKVHVISFSITRICQMSVVSVELLIVVLFIWITQCTPCYVIESELVYHWWICLFIDFFQFTNNCVVKRYSRGSWGGSDLKFKGEVYGICDR